MRLPSVISPVSTDESVPDCASSLPCAISKSSSVILPVCATMAYAEPVAFTVLSSVTETPPIPIIPV